MRRVFMLVVCYDSTSKGHVVWEPRGQLLIRGDLLQLTGGFHVDGNVHGNFEVFRLDVVVSRVVARNAD
jgi:hypothetical protein